MTKQEFLDNLQENLQGLPKEEIEERLNFYSEMIDDKIEEGFDENDAVYSVETSFTTVTKEKTKTKSKRKLKTWEIVLLAVSFPIWFSLLIALFAVGLAVLVCVFAVSVSVFLVAIGLGVGSIGIILKGVFSLFNLGTLEGLAIIGIGIFALGLSFILGVLGRKIIVVFWKLTKKLIVNRRVKK